MKTKQGYWISLLLMVCLASVLVVESAFCGKPVGVAGEHGLKERDFQMLEIGDRLVYFHQRMLGDATVQGDFIVYQFDLETGRLIERTEHWRDDLPEELPPLGITMEEAEMMVEGEVLFTRLKIIAPGSPVYPIEPTPMNPCWVVRSQVNGRQKVSVIDAVTGTFLGYGIAPPSDAFSLGGPDHHDELPCDEYYYDPWALNAYFWFDSMGYSATAVNNPAEAIIQGQIQNRTTALFYELAHGDSYGFLHTCPDGNIITDDEIEAWIADYPRMPFTFLGSCGGMCDTGDEAFSYEFRKGTSTGAVTVGYCGMASTDCADCWDNSIGWQDTLFAACLAGETVSDAVIAANLAYPMCAAGSCTRFAGDETLALVPVLPRDPNYPPIAQCRDVTVSADANCEAMASIDDGSYDTDGDPITLGQSPPGPYALGTTLVTLTVTDDRGLTDNCTGYVTVVDDTPPDITCPDDATVECSDYCGTPASDPQLAGFIATATDNCDSSPAVSDNAPGCFPAGTTTVTFTAVDNAGNVSTCEADVTVVDTTPPDITCPADVTVECSDHCGTPANDPQLAGFFAGVSAVDICDDTVDLSDDRPACFPLGPTTVTFTATDGSGNAQSCPAVVIVVDTTPPEISVELSRDVLWPANHKMSDITATVEVSDVCDPDPVIALVSITSSEPDDGLGDGDMPDDIQGADFGTEDYEFQLRSERAGPGCGRIYTVEYSATDGSGNVATATAEVFVPHDQSGFASASAGFSATGDALLPGVEEYKVVIRGMSDLPMSENDGVIVPRAYVGNHIGAIAPLSHRYYFADEDGYVDLELTYDARATRALQAVSGEMYPVGLHYERTNATSYLVPDIFALGPPLGSSSGVTPDGRDTDGATVSIELFRPVPNPTNGTTRMAYSVSTSNGAQVNISIYGVTGQRIRDLVGAYQSIGVYEAVWDGRNNDGVPVPSGMYFYRSVIGNQTRTSRVTLVR